VRALVAEFIGTFALVFAGCGAVMVDASTHQLGHLGVAAAFGLAIMVMIYGVGHISGAHFNPAVTATFALTRHFPWGRVPGYWAAQVAGAFGRGCSAARVTRRPGGPWLDHAVGFGRPIARLRRRHVVLAHVRDHGRGD